MATHEHRLEPLEVECCRAANPWVSSIVAIHQRGNRRRPVRLEAMVEAALDHADVVGDVEVAFRVFRKQ